MSADLPTPVENADCENNTYGPFIWKSESHTNHLVFCVNIEPGVDCVCLCVLCVVGSVKFEKIPPTHFREEGEAH